MAKAPADGSAPRCPEHGLVCVLAREIVLTGGDPMLGTSLAGRFTIVARLGTGSMGAVYRARQESMGREVALKVLRRDRPVDEDTRMRFLREARATSMLTSPHTVGVLDFGEAEDGAWFLAMELLEGETLGERLRRVGRLAPAEALSIARQALLSLAEAHAKGIVHRDLKPDNLFLVKAPLGAIERCKVLDFGIAKVARDREPFVDPLETQSGTVFGTPRYMSPEQALGGVIDARSDLYSLGVILYQMLAGRAPFVDDDAVVVMARHVREQPPALATVAPDANVPGRIEALVQRALRKRVEERQQSAAEFITELDAVFDDHEEAASGPHATSWAAASPGSEVQRDAAPRPKGIRSVLVAAGMAVAVVAALGIFKLAGGAGVPRSVNAADPAPKPAAALVEPGALSLKAPQAPQAVSVKNSAPLPSSSLLAKIPRAPAAKPTNKTTNRSRRPGESIR